MDPNLFHLDWDRVFEVLVTIIVLAFILERALALLFESRVFVNSRLDKSIGKEAIAFALAAGVCVYWQFDALSVIILTGHTTPFGEVVTGAVVAGGSKASIKLFQDVMNIKSSAVEDKDAAARAQRQANALAVLAAAPAPPPGTTVIVGGKQP